VLGRKGVDKQVFRTAAKRKSNNSTLKRWATSPQQGEKCYGRLWICSPNRNNFVERTLSLPVLKGTTLPSLPPLALLVHRRGDLRQAISRQVR